MLTVEEAAREVGKDPETVRRWIRGGKLVARKVGLQYMIDEADLPVSASTQPPLPKAWTETITGEPMPDVVEAIRSGRSGR